jgi:hypothetical protein
MAFLTRKKGNFGEKVTLAFEKNANFSLNIGKMAKIGKNWQKLAKIGKNWQKLAKIGKNWQKLAKIVIITSVPGSTDNF